MGVKLIETQVALHRTMDLGKIQAEHNNHGTQVQAHLTEQKKKQDEIKRKKVVGLLGEDKEKTGETRKKDHLDQHPHKGKHFDFRG